VGNVKIGKYTSFISKTIEIVNASSMATRIAYALILLVNSIISWIMLTDVAIKKLEHLTLDYMHLCKSGNCYGFVAVHRFNFALGVFHALMAIMLLGVRNSKDGRAPIQNGFWGPKIIAWIGLIVVSFFIPESFFVTWAKYFSLAGALLFLLLGLILLVDLSHNWAEYCQEKIETTESKLWTGLLVGSTLIMYVAALVMTIVMYIFFAGHNCSMNQAAITVGAL
jgi:serine incorporator 1/3